MGLLRVSRLDLQGNALQTLPESFYAMHTLETVNLSYNSIVDLDMKISQMRKLKILLLQHNKISRLPHTMAEMHWLVRVGLVGNSVAETDSVFEQLEAICAKNGGKIVA